MVRVRVIINRVRPTRSLVQGPRLDLDQARDEARAQVYSQGRVKVRVRVMVRVRVRGRVRFKPPT